ncbi:MAG TPA: FAD-binding protein [bacterium]|nr:FAD-binding protein [bacterium]
MTRHFNKALDRLEGRPYHPAPLFFIVLAVGVGRTVEEIYLARLGLGLSILSHYTAFYLATFLGFTLIASTLLGESWKKVSRSVVFGILVGLLPPLIDVFWLGPGNFRYFYLDRFYPTLHGAGNSYSEAIAAWSALVAFAVYLFLRSRSPWRTLLGAALGYLFLIATVTLYPKFGNAVFGSLKEGSARGFGYLFLSFVLYVALNFRNFLPSLKRVNHSLPWVALVFLGAALAGDIGNIRPMTWLQALIVLLIHQGVVAANDYYDRDSDALNQRVTRIDRDDLIAVHGLIVWLALTVCFAAPKLGYLYLLYLLFTAAYHHPLTRLKRIFPINYAIEGLVASLALLIGMASTGRYELTGMELAYAGAAFIGFAASSPFKDYKDVPGDEATGTRTLYVVLSGRGWSLAATHRLVSCIVLSFLMGPLFVLYGKGVPILHIALILGAFVLPTFFSLRGKEKKSTVERTAWLITGYLIVSVIALHLATPASPPSTVSGPLKDFGQLRLSADTYESSHPSSLEEVVALVRKANQSRTPIRVRGKAHSMNGASLPRSRELLILTDRLRGYRFGEPGSITVGAGMGIYELRAFLKDQKFRLPVTNDGQGGPTVGGFIAAGGIGGRSDVHGGFWENVLEMTLVTGAGDVLQIRPGDDLFPWMFGSMGQLGIVVSAKLKILGPDPLYPLNEEGTVPPINAGDAEPLYWFTLFVPTAELDAAKEAIQRIRETHAKTFLYRQDYVYPIKFVSFNPPLIFPANMDFVGVGIWGSPVRPDPSLVLAVERDVMSLVAARHATPYRRYIQSEVVSPGTDYRAYFGDVIYQKFLGLKKKLDPGFLLNCGVVFACSNSD